MKFSFSTKAFNAPTPKAMVHFGNALFNSATAASGFSFVQGNMKAGAALAGAITVLLVPEIGWTKRGTLPTMEA